MSQRASGMTSPYASTMNDDMQSSLYNQLFSESQLYDECQIYGAAPLCDENLPYNDWFSYGVNDYSSMADGSEMCDSHSQRLSSYGGSEGCSEASSPHHQCLRTRSSHSRPRRTPAYLASRHMQVSARQQHPPIAARMPRLAKKWLHQQTH